MTYACLKSSHELVYKTTHPAAELIQGTASRSFPTGKHAAWLPLAIYL